LLFDKSIIIRAHLNKDSRPGKKMHQASLDSTDLMTALVCLDAKEPHAIELLRATTDVFTRLCLLLQLDVSFGLAPPHVDVKLIQRPTLKPSVWKEGDKTTYFQVLIDQKDNENDLFIFNDNEDNFLDDNKNGLTGGNAIIREKKYKVGPNGGRRAFGIPTGPEWLSLTAHVRQVIDQALSAVQQILQTHQYRYVWYSATQSGELGTMTFPVGQDVKKHRVDGLKSLCVTEVPPRQPLQPTAPRSTPPVVLSKEQKEQQQKIAQAKIQVEIFEGMVKTFKERKQEGDVLAGKDVRAWLRGEMGRDLSTAESDLLVPYGW
jgi:hypothetical protein